MFSITVLPGKPGRAVLGAIVVLAALVRPPIGHATEIIPSIGWSKSVHGGDDARVLGGVAFRGHLLPLVKTEVGLAYRSDARNDGNLKVRMWPVTASAYLAPVPMLYAGAGVGWYHTTFDYASGAGIPDETKEEFGVHLGGGMEIPLGPAAAVDLNGRYVMMRDQRDRLVPEKLDPDFWMTSLGLALKF